MHEQPIIIRSQLTRETGDFSEELRDRICEEAAWGVLMADGSTACANVELRIGPASGLGIGGGWLVYYIDSTVSFIHLWDRYDDAIEEIRQTVDDLNYEAQREGEDARWFTWLHEELAGEVAS